MRDRAIQHSQVFIFIVTHSAVTSDEIKHELKKAKDKEGSDIRVFVDQGIWNADEELKITIDHQTIYLKDFQNRRFETKEGLLREVSNSTLLTRIIRPN